MDEECIIKQRVMISEVNYKRLAKLCNSLISLESPSQDELDTLRENLMLEFQSYDTTLTRMQLQTRMNEQEIEQYKAEKSSSNEKISRLAVKTSELQAKLISAQERRAHREEYSKFAEELSRPRKFEIKKRLLDYAENEGKAIEAAKKTDENTEQEKEATLENNSSVNGTDGDNDDEMVDAEPIPPREPTIHKLSLLNLAREDAARQNASLVDEISDLEARKEMYERTWNQRKEHFQEILEGLHRFRSQVLEEKMEQERQEGMVDDDSSVAGVGVIQTSRATSVHEEKMDTS